MTECSAASPCPVGVLECAVNVLAAAILGRIGFISHSLSKPSISPTRGERNAGRTLVVLWLLNAAKKLYFSGIAVALRDMLLPCHMFTALCSYCFLGTGEPARSTSYALVLWSAWMPLLALAFPDKSGATTLGPAGRLLYMGSFYVHHAILVFVPVFLHHRSKLTRRWTAPPVVVSACSYGAFMHAYLGVMLPVLARVTDANVNYGLYPPALPPAVSKLLRPGLYRAQVGGVLLLLGPLLAIGWIPLASSLLNQLLRGYATRRRV
jgi:hypothetical protein